GWPVTYLARTADERQYWSLTSDVSTFELRYLMFDGAIALLVPISTYLMLTSLNRRCGTVLRFSSKQLLSMVVVCAGASWWCRTQVVILQSEELLIAQLRSDGNIVTTDYCGPLWLSHLIPRDRLSAFSR